MDVREKLRLIMEDTSLAEGDVIPFDLRLKKNYTPPRNTPGDVVNLDGSETELDPLVSKAKKFDQDMRQASANIEKLLGADYPAIKARLAADPEHQARMARLDALIKWFDKEPDAPPEDAPPSSHLSLVSSQDEPPQKYGPGLFGEPGHRVESYKDLVRKLID